MSCPPKKQCHSNFCNTVGFCWQILRFFSLLQSEISAQISRVNKSPHINCIAALIDQNWAVITNISYVYFTKSTEYLNKAVDMTVLHTNICSKSFTRLTNGRVDKVLVKNEPDLNRLLFQFIYTVDFCPVNTFQHGRPYLTFNWFKYGLFGHQKFRRMNSGVFLCSSLTCFATTTCRCQYPSI